MYKATAMHFSPLDRISKGRILIVSEVSGEYVNLLS